MSDLSAPSLIDIEKMKSFQNKRDHEKPGVYEIVGTLSKHEISTGDTTFLSVYISGYGNVGGAKVYFMPSSEIFDQSSTVDDGMNIVKQTSKGTYIEFGDGRGREFGKALSIITTLHGWQSENWD
ncbi:hypothetical protein [Agriterribacter sp.]|uniref:hypothetical protein n=1 Tax=Agriterribacter sp. TaxID=2821509 RepID=UPI002D7FA2B5|nr:hypothetical protein [Agriterribacter sp.]